MTAMPISMGLPRQSLIFWRLFDRVMIFSEIFLPLSAAMTAAALALLALESTPRRLFCELLSTSPL